MDVVSFITKYSVTREIAERIVRGYTEVAGTEVEPEIQQARIAICEGCKPQFDKNRRLCQKEYGGCGCFVDIKTKYLEIDFVTYTETVKCPQGKWE